MIVEVEVDTLDQLDEVLPAGPDIVLLDNMTPEQLAEAVRRRDLAGADTDLGSLGRCKSSNGRRDRPIRCGSHQRWWTDPFSRFARYRTRLDRDIESLELRVESLELKVEIHEQSK